MLLVWVLVLLGCNGVRGVYYCDRADDLAAALSTRPEIADPAYSRAELTAMLEEARTQCAALTQTR